MKKKWWILSLVAVVIIIVVVVLTRQKPEPKVFAKVTRGDIKETVVATGDIVPRHAVSVISQIPGTIGKIYVKEGQLVKKGQKLFLISPSVTPSALSQAVSALDQAKANLREAHKSFVSNRYVYQQHAIARVDFDKIVSAYHVAKAQYNQAKQAYDLLLHGGTTIAGRKVQNTIYAPLSGYILHVSVDVGDTITATTQYQAGTSLATLANMSDLLFKGEVSQVDVGKLKVGMASSLQVAALPKLNLNGKLSLISLQSSDSTSSSPLTTNQELFATPSTLQDGFGIQVDQFKLPKTVTLRAGYQATATILVAEKKGILMLPQSVLHFDNGKVYVLLAPASKKEQAKKQFVTLGLSNDESAQIVSGLKLGQEIEVPVANSDDDNG